MSPDGERSRRVPESATTRLTRLLTMVPWLVNRQGIELRDAAAGLGVTEAQLRADLDLLFMCGYGSMPDELIDVQWQSGHVYVTNAETISRPLRLEVDEAITLMVGLRALLTVPGLEERDAVERTLAKLEEATGAIGQASARVAVTIEEDVGADVLDRARRAVEQRRRLHLHYLVPSRDESTERDVDPMRVIAAEGHWYLEGFCHRADGVRVFRLDRVEALSVLDEDGTPPEGVGPRELGESIFSPTEDDLVVTLRLHRGARWISDYYPVESVTDDGDVRTITLRTADTAWLERLVLRMGGHVVVLSPDDLSERIAARAHAALAPQTHDVD